MELKLLVVVSCLSWVLRTELGSFARAIHAINHRAISLVPTVVFVLSI